MTVPVVLEEFINRFKGWISGSGDLTELVGAFSSLSTYTIIAFVAIGLSLLIFGKKLFAVFYAVLWTVIGSHVGYLWGQGMETLYTIELMILIGVLLHWWRSRLEKYSSLRWFYSERGFSQRISPRASVPFRV